MQERDPRGHVKPKRVRRGNQCLNVLAVGDDYPAYADTEDCRSVAVDVHKYIPTIVMLYECPSGHRMNNRQEQSARGFGSSIDLCYRW